MSPTSCGVQLHQLRFFASQFPLIQNTRKATKYMIPYQCTLSGPSENATGSIAMNRYSDLFTTGCSSSLACRICFPGQAMAAYDSNCGIASPKD